MIHTWNSKEVSDYAMVMVRVDFETIKCVQGIFKCPSELHLDVSYQHIIQSTIRKWLIDCQPESEENHKLPSIIDSKLEIEFDLADIRQEPGKYEMAAKVLQCSADILAPKLANIDSLVNMVTLNI